MKFRPGRFPAPLPEIEINGIYALIGLTADNIIDSILNETVIKIDGYRHKDDRAIYMPSVDVDNTNRDLVFEVVVTAVDHYRCRIDDGEMIVKLGIVSISGCPVDYDFLNVYLTVHFYGNVNCARADFDDPEGHEIYDHKQSMCIVRSRR